MAKDPELDVIESIYDALDRGEPETAFALAREAIEAAVEEDPVLRFLAGRALLEADRPAEATEHLERAVEGDPEDPEFRVNLAWALFRACRFEHAAEQLAAVPDSTPPLPESRYIEALLLERRGEIAEADRRFEAASRLDAEAFPRPVRLDEVSFEQAVEAARAQLPEEFRRHLNAVSVLVQDLPSAELLEAENPPLDPDQLLGLFEGLPIGEPAAFSPGGELPPRIHLFKRNLERYATDEEDLVEQIRVTLYHELGHYLGLDEDDLEQAGYS